MKTHDYPRAARRPAHSGPWRRASDQLDPSRLFRGGGQAGALVRSFDWSATPLGPVHAWPRSLVHYVRLILELPSPAIVFWGSEQTQIYNDGYAVIMGPRHPRYFGAPYRECWPDTYPLIYPWMRRVLDSGEVIVVDKSQITVTRHGHHEEAYFSFTFSPVRDDDGNIAGIYQPVTEVTDFVLSERRERSLRALEPRVGSADPLSDAVATLSSNDKDVPFAVIYLWEEPAQRLHPVAMSPNLQCPDVRLERMSALARRVFDSNESARVDDVPALLGVAHLGPWPEPASSAVVLPIETRAGPPRGVAVMGISPRLSFDERYAQFHAGVCEELGAVLTAADDMRRAAHRTFLSELTGELSLLDAPGDIVGTIGEKVGARLGLGCLEICEVDPDGGRVTAVDGWRREADRSPLPEHVASEYVRSEHARASRAGRTVAVRDTGSDPQTAALAGHGIGALVAVPATDGRKWTKLLLACDESARDWREEDVELLRQLPSRLFPHLERARAQAALRESEDRLKRAFSIETVGVLFFDLSGRMTDANRALERVSGWSREQLRNLDWKQLTPPEFMSSTMQAVEALATTGRSPPYEKQWIRPDGSRWWGLFAPTRLSGSGTESQCMELIIDITSRKQAEEALRERAEFEQQLIGIVSHDLKTPLSAILLTTGALLHAEEQSERTTKALTRIQSSGERAARLVQDLLDFSQARTGGIPLNVRPADLHAVTQEVVEEVQASFPERVILLDAEGDGRGEWDPDRVAQLLTNLLENALKYSPPDSAVRVLMRGGDESVELEVHNGGAPIAKETMARLFAPWQRGSSHGGRTGRSVGLGLYIVKSIAEAHRGVVDVTSSEQRGTTFRVRLPRWAGAREPRFQG